MIGCHFKAITMYKQIKLNISQTERLLLVTVLEKFAIVTNNDGTKSTKDLYGSVHKLAVGHVNVKKPLIPRQSVQQCGRI